MEDKNILFIGCGKMGQVIIEKIINNKKLQHNNYKVIDPNIADKNLSGDKFKNSNISYSTEISLIDNNYLADIIFLNIKPQQSRDILLKISQLDIYDENTIFISIIAGKKIGFFTDILGDHIKFVRTMPNLAIQYCHAVMPYKLSSNFKNDDKKLIISLFEDFGKIFEITNEELFNIITAIFGSGPGYIFLLQEILKNIAINNGVDDKIAGNLVEELFLGSSLMAKNSDKSFSQLLSDVSSNKGVTQVLIENLTKSNSLHEIFENAIAKAASRSKELGS